MDSCDDFKIFIPKEAEVKTVPLKTLPKATLRQMGLTQPVGIRGLLAFRDRTSSPEATYISPIEIRKKDGPMISQDYKDKLHMASKRQLRAQKPFNMHFVTHNLTALKLLEDLCNHTDTSPVPPCGSIPLINQDAAIIYGGQIYLSVKKRKPMGSQRQIPRNPNTDVPSPAIEITSDSDHDTNTDVPAAAIEITSASDYDSQEETQPQFRETSPELPKDELRKKEVKEQLPKRRCQVKLIRIPRETVNRLLAKTQMDSVSQKECYGTHEESLENHNRKKSLAQCEDNGLATDSQCGSDMEQVDTVVSESDGANPGEVRQSKHKKFREFPIASSGSEGEMEDACQQSTENMSENNASDSEGYAMDGNNNAVDSENDAGDCEDIAMDSENNVVDRDAQVDDGETNVAEISAELPLGRVFTATTGQHQNFDYNQLAKEEEIGRVRDKLKKLSQFNALWQ